MLKAPVTVPLFTLGQSRQLGSMPSICIGMFTRQT
ncbi:hypothetical protein [Pseudomonas phage vB_PaeM_RP11]|nr:MAG: hypothetical protein [Pseudomonas phage RP4]WAB57449.1 hypothetical protein [Pseudomonas phage vB_PaeM_RP9]WAB57853.1 hypothetical protein [Pseudomonas phage vB_PaeM_RP11]WAB57963.1 hypothetical protein [Pseudomonas phage vB_PaeM_RP12]WAB58140.1 hypothetical protein [Pseudomonas phage vB_PaeM_RP13]WAB58372.1 hypothetical protein [Pseudomonas phage vB_PaeM_RP14]